MKHDAKINKLFHIEIGYFLAIIVQSYSNA